MHSESSAFQVQIFPLQGSNGIPKPDSVLTDSYHFSDITVPEPGEKRLYYELDTFWWMSVERVLSESGAPEDKSLKISVHPHTPQLIQLVIANEAIMAFMQSKEDFYLRMMAEFEKLVPRVKGPLLERTGRFRFGDNFHSNKRIKYEILHYDFRRYWVLRKCIIDKWVNQPSNELTRKTDGGIVKIEPLVLVEGLGHAVDLLSSLRGILFCFRELFDELLLYLNNITRKERVKVSSKFAVFAKSIKLGEYDLLELPLLEYVKGRVFTIFKYRTLRNMVKTNAEDLEFEVHNSEVVVTGSFSVDPSQIRLFNLLKPDGVIELSPEQNRLEYQDSVDSLVKFAFGFWERIDKDIPEFLGPKRAMIFNEFEAAAGPKPHSERGRFLTGK